MRIEQLFSVFPRLLGTWAQPCCEGAMAEGLSEKASFLYNAVLKPQPDAEKARRFFPTLRKWAETGKEYRGTVFTFAEVEEAIAAFERSAIPRNVPSPQQQKTEWWPRWALNKASGVEVLAPLKGKPTWTHATPVALGYHGQKKCFLFVRSESFEMDCRRSEVRPVGSNRTAQQQMDDLISRGHRPEDNQDWTDGSDVNMSDEVSIDFIRPGVPERSKSGSSGAQAALDCLTLDDHCGMLYEDVLQGMLCRMLEHNLDVYTYDVHHW